MAPRANWKGYLKLSLVSCAVELYPATTQKDRVAFNLLNRETGNRLKRQLIDPETEEVVESHDQVKGYAIGKREYIIVDEKELDDLAIESTHTIDIESFVPRSEIDDTYIDTPYYLTPDGRVAEEAFAVIRDAMREKGVVGIGRVVLYRRERIVMLEPRGKGLVAKTLRYAYEVRKDEEFFENIGDVKIAPEMLELATHIIDKKLSSFDPTRFEDRYQNAVLELIKAKSGKEAVPLPKAAPAPSNVISLMDALKKSVASEKTAEKARLTPAPRPAKAPAKSTARSDKTRRAAGQGTRLKRAS